MYSKSILLVILSPTSRLKACYSVMISRLVRTGIGETDFICHSTRYSSISIVTTLTANSYLVGSCSRVTNEIIHILTTKSISTHINRYLSSG